MNTIAQQLVKIAKMIESETMHRCAWEYTEEEEREWKKEHEKDIQEVENNVKEIQSLYFIDTDAGEMYVVTQRDGDTFYLGCGVPIGNFGYVRPDYKIEYDFSKSFDDNLADLYEEATEALKKEGYKVYE